MGCFGQAPAPRHGVPKDVARGTRNADRSTSQPSEGKGNLKSTFAVLTNQ